MQLNWTREETMLAFELYCIIPKGKDTVDNEQIIALASAINRSVNSVKLKLQNFKSYDPSYTQNGRVGLSHGSKLDEEVCKEFFQNWNDLVFETNEIKDRLKIQQIKQTTSLTEDFPIGKDIVKTRKERLGQDFFRKTLLASYNNRCCFTGISIPELLRASHIKSWSDSDDINEKTNPRNGLLLNALHDAAFDRGLMTITTDYKIMVSKKLLNDNEENKLFFGKYHNKEILLPTRFLPDIDFIRFHNKKFIL
jgi:putative restriction endonuclease